MSDLNEVSQITAAILLEDEREFTTGQIIRIDGHLYYRLQNGGARGAWQDRRDTCKHITLAEAWRIALEWESDPAKVLAAIGDDEEGN